MCLSPCIVFAMPWSYLYVVYPAGGCISQLTPSGPPPPNVELIGSVAAIALCNWSMLKRCVNRRCLDNVRMSSASGGLSFSVMNPRLGTFRTSRSKLERADAGSPLMRRFFPLFLFETKLHLIMGDDDEEEDD